MRLKYCILSTVASLAFLAPATLPAGEPPTEPVLRIETGMHTARIKHIAVDAANRFFVTVSEDKTLRVWGLPNGELLRVMRPPLGPGNEGKLSAVAISPDGRTIAAGGYTGIDWEDFASIDLFDRETGRLRQRIGGLARGIHALAFSADGRFLAAALGDVGGVRLFDTQTLKEVGQDRAYEADSLAVTFSSEGRLATTSLDGFVRLYALDGGSGNRLRLVTRRNAGDGTQPDGLAFSPDGQKLAFGAYNRANVEVLSAADLSHLVSPAVSGIHGDDRLQMVAWSADGRTLFAGGSYTSKGIAQIRSWSGGGAGPYQDLPASEYTITDLAPLADGSLLFASEPPGFGRIDRQGRRTLLTGASTADYHAGNDKFLLSQDGSVVQFGYRTAGIPARFSIVARRLELDPPADGHLKGPRTEVDGLKVIDWQGTSAPKINTRALTLLKLEFSTSAAIAPAGDRVLLGTTWQLYLFNKEGASLGSFPVPGIAWGVNISGNGSVAVAALGDGTIRWYRLRDGKELLAFFPHADKKRWVLWSPSGYYDCSPGAEDLIGWHVNRGKDATADFFPASRFRDVYYRPDIVAKVLGALDEGEAIRLANAEAGRKSQTTSVASMLPPVVEITSPADGTEVAAQEIVVRFEVRSPSAQPITRVRALVDGRPVEARKGIGVAEEHERGIRRELTIPIPSRDNQVSILAENANAVSTPATIRLKWKGKAPEEFVIKPRLYVLAIGVSKYQNQKLTLRYPAKDAGDFAAVMSQQKGSLYRDVVTKVLTDDHATKDEILDGLDWITKETTSKDVAAVFMSGHGVNDANGQYYFLPHNADVEKLKRSGLSFSDVQSTVAALAGKTLFFVDTCDSGNVMGPRKGITDINGIINELASAENGAVVFAASTGNQYSLEDPAWNNGAFTKAVVEGLSGRADYTHTGKISINMLDLYISERVKELTKGRQTPTTTKPQTISDFPVAIVAPATPVAAAPAPPAGSAFQECMASMAPEAYDRAIASCGDAVRLDPGLSEPYLVLAGAHDALWQRALQSATPDAAAIQEHRGKAAENYRKFLDLNRGDTVTRRDMRHTVLSRLLAIYFLGGDRVRELEYANELAGMTALTGSDNYFVGAAYLRLSRPERSEQFFKAYQESAPSDVHACEILARLYYEPVWNGRGRFDDSMATLERCAGLPPTDPARYYALALFFWDTVKNDQTLSDSQKLAYIERGLRHIDRALELQKDFFGAMACKALLLRLKSDAVSEPALRQRLLDEADALQKRALALKAAGVPVPPGLAGTWLPPRLSGAPKH